MSSVHGMSHVMAETALVCAMYMGDNVVVRARISSTANSTWPGSFPRYSDIRSLSGLVPATSRSVL